MYILVFLFWLILNGKITVEILTVGAVLTFLVAALLNILYGYTPKRDLNFLKKAPLFLIYILVLIREIIKASLSMIPYILHPDRAEPVLVTFRPELTTDFGRYILANSITLTPGTITVQAAGKELTVHCLKRDMLDTSPDSAFIRWIHRLEV